jgi:hypothetical protein
MKESPRWKKINNWESSLYPKPQRIRLSKKMQLFWIDFLVSHYSTPKIELLKNTEDDCVGYYLAPNYRKPAIIALDVNCNLGTVCHEFAHHLTWIKYCSIEHNKDFIIILTDVYKVIHAKLKEMNYEEKD